MTINARYNEIYLQYVYYNLLAHILFFASSYVLVLVLYMAQSVLLYYKEEPTFPKYKGDLTKTSLTLPKYKGDFTQV